MEASSASSSPISVTFPAVSACRRRRRRSGRPTMPARAALARSWIPFRRPTSSRSARCDGRSVSPTASKTLSPNSRTPASSASTARCRASIRYRKRRGRRKTGRSGARDILANEKPNAIRSCSSLNDAGLICEPAPNPTAKAARPGRRRQDRQQDTTPDGQQDRRQPTTRPTPRRAARLAANCSAERAGPRRRAGRAAAIAAPEAQHAHGCGGVQEFPRERWIELCTRRRSPT